MPVMMKQLLGFGVVATALAFPVWAVVPGDVQRQHTDHCRIKAAGWVKSSAESACLPSRHPNKMKGTDQAVRGRDALLHYRGGESRPRMVRAAYESQAFVPQA